MIPLAPPFRRAGPGDGAVLAELVNQAGEGMPLHLWQGLAGPGEDPWAIGAARQLAKLEKGDIVVVDEGAGALAQLTGYAIGAEPKPLDGVPAVFAPLIELENLALGSWYVNVLAVLPEHRGRGLGTQLLALAEGIARADGLDRMSIIVADDNTGAQELYRRTGYAETARRPMVADGWKTAGRDWVLMAKRIA